MAFQTNSQLEAELASLREELGKREAAAATIEAKARAHCLRSNGTSVGPGRTAHFLSFSESARLSEDFSFSLPAGV